MGKKSHKIRLPPITLRKLIDKGKLEEEKLIKELREKYLPILNKRRIYFAIILINIVLFSGFMVHKYVYPSPRILLNQVGYTPTSNKIFMIESSYKIYRGTFDLTTETGEKVIEKGDLEFLGILWGNYYYQGDFSEVSQIGNYSLTLTLAEQEFNYKIEIKDTPYRSIVESIITNFYHFRINGDALDLWNDFSDEDKDPNNPYYYFPLTCESYSGYIEDSATPWRTDNYNNLLTFYQLSLSLSQIFNQREFTLQSSLNDIAYAKLWNETVWIYSALSELLEKHNGIPEWIEFQDDKEVISATLVGYEDLLWFIAGTSLLANMSLYYREHEGYPSGFLGEKELENSSGENARGEALTKLFTTPETLITEQQLLYEECITQSNPLAALNSTIETLDSQDLNNTLEYLYDYRLYTSMVAASFSLFTCRPTQEYNEYIVNFSKLFDKSLQLLITLSQEKEDEKYKYLSFENVGYGNFLIGLLSIWAQSLRDPVKYSMVKDITLEWWRVQWSAQYSSFNFFHLPFYGAYNHDSILPTLIDRDLGHNEMYGKVIFGLTQAIKLWGENESSELKYLKDAIIDWILGKNPLSITMIEGCGTQNLAVYSRSFYYGTDKINPRNAIKGAVPMGYIIKDGRPYLDLDEVNGGSATVQEIDPRTNTYDTFTTTSILLAFI